MICGHTIFLMKIQQTNTSGAYEMLSDLRRCSNKKKDFSENASYSDEKFLRGSDRTKPLDSITHASFVNSVLKMSNSFISVRGW